MTEARTRRSHAFRIFVVVAVTNFTLFLVKFLPNLFFQSLSVQADALNSFADFLYSIILLVGILYAYRSRDETHQHGHERIEPFLSLVIAVSIFATGIFLVRQAVLSLVYTPQWSFTPLFVLVLLVSMGVKYVLARYLERSGEQKNIEIAVSTAKDSRADVLASATALTGVFGAYFGYLYLDAVFALGVSLWIFRTAYGISKRNFRYLTGASPPEEAVERIREAIESDEVDCLDLEVHYVGPELHVYCEIDLPKDLELGRTHEIEEKIKDKLKNIEEIESVYVHTEPRPSGSEGPEDRY